MASSHPMAPGLHSPPQAPSTQANSHSSSAPHMPSALQVCWVVLPRHRVLPGSQLPTHRPATQTNSQASPAGYHSPPAQISTCLPSQSIAPCSQPTLMAPPSPPSPPSPPKWLWPVSPPKPPLESTSSNTRPSVSTVQLEAMPTHTNSVDTMSPVRALTMRYMFILSQTHATAFKRSPSPRGLRP